MNHEKGFTVVFAVGVLGLLSLLAVALAAPSVLESHRLRLYQARMQAEYLSLAGIEHARSDSARGQISDATYDLAGGTVTISIQRLDGNECRVQSTGSLRLAWRKQPVEVRTEARISTP
jgi:type II secretory pathway component PulK